MRVLAESRNVNASARAEHLRHVLIIGAGDAGALVVLRTAENRQLSLVPAGFLDDDPAKQKHQIYGVQVVGTLSDLPHVLDNRNVDEVIIAIPSAPARVGAWWRMSAA